MTDLKLIPKPEGFELRDKRSDKSGAGADWLPGDLLYDTQQRLKDKTCRAMLIICAVENDDGKGTYTLTRYAGPENTKLRLLVEGLGREMGWKE